MAEKEKSKRGLGLLVGALAGITGIALLSRKAEAAPPPEGTVHDIVATIELFDSAGNRILKGSPYSLPEGDLVTIKISAKNKSTETTAGGIVSYISIDPLIVSVQSELTNGPTLISGTNPGDIGYIRTSLAAGSATPVSQSIASIVFRVPMGTQNLTGYLSIRFIFPDGTHKDASADLVVVGALVVYDVEIVWV